MYTRTENPLHVIQEVIDNAADEAMAGFCRKIGVTLHLDGSVSVSTTARHSGRDPPGRGRVDGRGGVHPPPRRRQVQQDRRRLGLPLFSGGLHGVGVSVTNALSHRLEVRWCATAAGTGWCSRAAT